MTEEQKNQIIEEQIELLVDFNQKSIVSEPEQVRLNCQTIVDLISYLPNTKKTNVE